MAAVAVFSICLLNAGKRKEERFDPEMPRVAKRQRSESPVEMMNMSDPELEALKRSNKAKKIDHFVDTLNNYPMYYCIGDQEFPKNYPDQLRLHAEALLSWQDIKADSPKAAALLDSAKLEALSAKKSLLLQLRKRTSDDDLIERLKKSILQESMNALQ